MNEKELNEKWNIHDVVDQAVRGAMQKGYDESSKESALQILSLQKDSQFMKDEISEVKELVKEIKTTLHEVIKSKADKEEVDDLKLKYESMVIWVLRLGIGGIVGVLTFLAVELFNHLKQ